MFSGDAAVVRALLLLLPLALAACGGSKLASPEGAVFAFNPDKWTPEPGDLTVPQRVRR